MNETLENKYICKYCGKIYNAKFTLTKHINIVHLKVTKISYKCKNKKICPNCNKEISLRQFNRHFVKCKDRKINFDILEIFNRCIFIDSKYICPICNKVFDKHGIKHHIWFNHTENGKQFRTNHKFGYEKGTRSAWNKGLTKDTDERVRKSVNTRNNNKILGKYKIRKFKHSDKTKEKLRTIALKNNFGGVCRKKSINYKNIFLGSTYEVELAKDLDKNKIRWIIPKRIKYYDLNNKLHYYTPDFYLPDYDFYLDPKNDFLINNINPYFGYKDSDKIKWVCEQNNIKVFILNKNQLSWKYIKENLI